MNKYLENEKGYRNLCTYIFKRNRILLGIYLLFTLIITCILYKVKFYALMWIILIGAIDHNIYTSFYNFIGCIISRISRKILRYKGNIYNNNCNM